MDNTDSLQQINMTKQAAEKISQMVKSQPADVKGLRLVVVPGGCSGFMYNFLFEKKINDADTVIESNGTKLIVDQISLDMLKGAKIDYVEGLEESGLKIINPNAKSTCGCGHSFS